MNEPGANTIQSNTGMKVLLFSFTLVALFFAMTILVGEAEAQVRRAKRLQKRIEKMEKGQQRQGANKLNPSGASSGDTASETTTASGLSGQPGSTIPKNNIQAGRPSLEGIREKGLINLFRPEEREMIIQGLGNPAALLIVFRQLDLSDQQRQDIRAIRLRVGNRLGILQREHRELDLELTDAIYGENFDPKRVEELAAQVAERQSEIIKLRASIEAQLRQIMTLDQFFVFRGLIGEMVLPQRRILPAQLRQMNQRRGAPPNRPNQQKNPQ